MHIQGSLYICCICWVQWCLKRLKLGKLQNKSNFNKNGVLSLNLEKFETKGIYDALRNHLNSFLVPLHHLMAPVCPQAI